MASIAYLTRNGLLFYNHAQSSVLSLNFTHQTVRDLEVLNKEELKNQIKTFVSANRINPSSLVIVLGHEVYFEKRFSSSLNGQQKNHIDNFLDSVPFDPMVSLTLNQDREFRVVAANKELCEVVKEGFESLNFKVEAVSPDTLMTTQTFDAEAGKFVNKNIELFKNNNFIETAYPPESFTENLPAGRQVQPDKKRLMILLVVFAALAVILVVFMLNTFILRK